ncbi:TPA: phytanoyl-CoA dioxygenase, partial [Candidatus Poribacteria bacterium]|nr:phytanoyl-CoA dioxygenase [Candidatus Poribacteria bacterium]
ERLTDDEDLVRRNAALSLARIGKNASAALPALSEALYDDNHFVRAFSLQALERIGTQEATETSIDYLRSARWCTSH